MWIDYKYISLPRQVSHSRPMLLYYCSWLRAYTHIYITDIVKIQHKDHIVLTPKHLGEASL